MYQAFKSADEEWQWMIADNSLNQSWDGLDLSQINADLPEFGPFDLELLGFKDFQVDVADLYADKDPDEVPEVKESIAKTGDLWILGDHRLLCGDCTDPKNIERLMNGEEADMVFTDPPYGIAIDASYGDRMKGSAKSGLNDRAKKVYSNIIGDDNQFDPTYILGAFSNSKIFLWGANNYTEKLPRGQWFVWYKKITDGMKKMFGWDFELCWTNQTAGQVYEHGWAGCLGHNKILDGDTKTHPSMKSVQLILSIFNDYEAGTVWDGYLGSGSTLIACEKTGRKCYGMEIDPHYVDIIVARWEKFTGKVATKSDA